MLFPIERRPLRPRTRAMSRERTARPGRVITNQDGFTIVEVLVAAVLVAVGILTTLTVLDASRRLNLTSEHKTTMGQRAQAELERLVSLPWNQVALTGTSSSWSSTPGDYTYVSSSPGSCPTNPSGPAPTYQPDHASGGSSSTEATVINGCAYTNTVNGNTQTVTPTQGTVAPVQNWSAPLRDGTTIGGQIYDFVTWTADPTCSQTATPGSNCSTTNDYKRVTVVVTMTGPHPTQPAIYSEFVTPPNNGHPPNSGAGTACTQGTQTVSCTNTPPTGQVPTQSYALCDTSSSQSQCGEPLGCTGNTLHNTITGSGNLPDLLGTAQPTGSCSPTPPCLDTDLAPGCTGLQMTPTPGTTCGSPPASNSQAHAWTTPAIASGTTWTLTGTGTMTAYVESSTTSSVSATLCLAMYVLPNGPTAGQGLGSQIGSTYSQSVSASAGSPTPATFDFTMNSSTYALASTGLARVEVVLWFTNTATPVDLIYDQVQAASQVTFLLQT